MEGAEVAARRCRRQQDPPLTVGTQAPDGVCDRRRETECELEDGRRVMTGQVGGLRWVEPYGAIAPPQAGQMSRDRPVRQR